MHQFFILERTRIFKMKKNSFKKIPPPQKKNPKWFNNSGRERNWYPWCMCNRAGQEDRGLVQTC